MLDYNPYLQGNPLMANVTPEMQEAARQRAIFNAGAAMLGSAGRGESFVSGLSQAGQMYGGSLDQMMNEGLRYQSARQQQEHQKELMGLEREKLKQEAELQQKANETRIKAAQIGSAAGLAQAEMLRKQMEQQERARKLNETIGSQMLLGQVDQGAPSALESRGYVIDKSNPLAAGAAASLNRRELGIAGPLSLEQQASIASRLPERERTTWALQQNLMQPDEVRAAYPERFMQNQFGLMGGGEQVPAPTALTPAPISSRSIKKQLEVNKLAESKRDEVNTLFADMQKEMNTYLQYKSFNKVMPGAPMAKGASTPKESLEMRISHIEKLLDSAEVGAAEKERLAGWLKTLYPLR